MLGSILGGSEAIPALSATERSTIRIKRPPPCACSRRLVRFSPAYGTLRGRLNRSGGNAAQANAVLPTSPALAYARRQTTRCQLAKGRNSWVWSKEKLA